MSRRKGGPPWSNLLCAGGLIGLMSGCAGGIPQAIRETPQVNPSPLEVQERLSSHLGQRVRWGGTILAVRNGARSTEIRILARPLGWSGEPDDQAQGLGRFIAEFAGFKDPQEYPQDRSLTVVGLVSGLVTRPVGDFDYPYPVIAVEASYLWPEPVPVFYPPPFVDPWYGLWYGPPVGPWYRPWR